MSLVEFHLMTSPIVSYRSTNLSLQHFKLVFVSTYVYKTAIKFDIIIIKYLTISSEQFEIDAKFQTTLHFERKEAKTKNKYMKNKNFKKLKYVPGNPQNAGFYTIYPIASRGLGGPRTPA